jgi:hypothetical protein
MTGLVSVPAAPHSPAGSLVEADGWFPSIDVNAMRDAMRLRGEVPHSRLVEAIRGGMLTVMAQTDDWASNWRKNGASSLAQVKPDKTLDDQHLLTMLYIRAVRFYAAAELADLARDSSATREEVDRIEEESLVAPDLRAHALAAVRDMLGVTRVAVELI